MCEVSSIVLFIHIALNLFAFVFAMCTNANEQLCPFPYNWYSLCLLKQMVMLNENSMKKIINLVTEIDIPTDVDLFNRLNPTHLYNMSSKYIYYIFCSPKLD